MIKKKKKIWKIELYWIECKNSYYVKEYLI